MGPEPLSALRIRTIIRQNSRSSTRKVGYVYMREFEGRLWATDLYFCVEAERLRPAWQKDGLDLAPGDYRVDGHVAVADPAEVGCPHVPIAEMMTWHTVHDYVGSVPWSYAGRHPFFFHRPSVEDTLVYFQPDLQPETNSFPRPFGVRYDQIELIAGQDWEESFQDGVLLFAIRAWDPHVGPVGIYRVDSTHDKETGLDPVQVTWGLAAPVKL